MKKTLFTLFAVFATSCWASGDLDSEHIDNLNLTLDDLLFKFSNSKGVYSLNAQQQEKTKGMDMIVSGLFTNDHNWVQQIHKDDRSYIGVHRAEAGEQSDAYSCAGGYATTTTDGYTFVFNRADPESKITTKELVPNNEEFVYNTKEGNPLTFTLSYLESALKGGQKAAIALLRTPKDYTDDMLAVSILRGQDEHGEYIFDDFVVACEVSAVGDDSSVDAVDYDPQRLIGAYYFLGESYGSQDIIAANHYVLTGDMPVPEPTTATLSLLALAALAARRRRR